VGFFQTVRAAITKGTVEGGKEPEELDAAIRQIISRAVSSDQVLDIFSAAGLKKPDISILSDEFLGEIRNMPHKNLAVETLRKLINDEIKARSRKYLVQSRSFAEMLEENKTHSITSFQIIQGDNKLLSAEELVPYLEDLQFDDAELAEVRDWLLEWDYQCDMESPQAALYAQFWLKLINNLYMDQLNEDIPVYGVDTEMRATFLLMQEPDNPWWDDISTNYITETRDDILVRSFEEGYHETVAALGKNRDNWRWGELHTATFVSNPLGLSGIGLIERIVNRGPVAVSGSTQTINNTVWVVPLDNFEVTWLTSMRMIIDLSDFAKSISIHTTGQSGHPYSENYDDMIDLWRKIEYHPMLWARGQVEAATVQRLILKPGN